MDTVDYNRQISIRWSTGNADTDATDFVNMTDNQALADVVVNILRPETPNFLNIKWT